MSSYQERKQARIDYYNEMAANSAKRSGEIGKQASDMASVIPFGQPILVGHHSEKRDRNYRGRISKKRHQSIKEADKAGYYAAKAEAAANNTAISSDDPEAVLKLEAQLAELENDQAFMKTANAYFRKHGTMVGCPGISDEDAGTLDARIDAKESWQQKQPYASYVLTNNGANIRRIKKRIAELNRRDELFSAGDGGSIDNPTGLEDRLINGWEFEGIDGNGGRVEMNKELNRIQIFFSSKPSEDVRTQLKSRGFKWAPSQSAWQRQLNANGLYAVKQIACIQPHKTA